MINLSKGESVNLTKEAPALKKIRVAAGWDPKAEGAKLDADLSVFTLANGKTRSEDDLVFYNQKQNAAKTVTHSGDNRTGDGEGDDETINVNLEALDTQITSVFVLLDIFEAEKKGQSLADLQNAYVRIVNDEDGVEISRFTIDSGLNGTTLAFGELTRGGDGWSFRAIGETGTAGLGGYITQFQSAQAA